MDYKAIIVGAGPAGLSCAKKLAGHGHRVLVLERKPLIGPKVCAGGITWSGLINKVPGHVEENRFPEQHIVTRLQSAVIREDEPIIATVDRERLGRHMAESAIAAGAEIRASCQVLEVRDREISFADKYSGTIHTLSCEHLVGADGSTSLVRRHLGLAARDMGIGINYQLPATATRMEWHLNGRFFRNGYGWIFPHKETVSIGAYADQCSLSAQQLKKGLIAWGATVGYRLDQGKPRAEFINFDYRGWRFGNVYLIGDAAGFASGLTGEGIYPAMVSGEFVGGYIHDRRCDPEPMERLIHQRDLHARMVKTTGKSALLAAVLAESATLLLRTGLLDFRKLEMAH